MALSTRTTDDVDVSQLDPVLAGVDLEQVPPSVQAMIGTVLERRYPVEGVLDVRDGVCRLQTSYTIEGLPVDLRVASVEASEAVRIAFGYEAELVARLAHPGCPRVFEFGSESDGTLFVVGSPVPPTALEQVLGTPMKSEEAVDIAHQLLDALAHVHAQGVAHGNVNDESVRVTADGDAVRVHLEGFSRARLATEQSIAAAARADVFGVGVILYQLLTGSPPLVGANTEGPRPFGASVPLPLAHVAMRMLATNPAVQFGGAAQAADALRNWRDNPVALVAEAGDDGALRSSDSTSGTPGSLGPAWSADRSGSRPSLPQPTRQTLPQSADDMVASTGDDDDFAPPSGRGRWLALGLLIGGGAVAFALLRPDALTPTAADNTAAAVLPLAGALAPPPALDAVTAAPTPTADQAAPAPPKRPEVGEGDPMELLAVVNNADLSAAPGFATRHAILDRLRATKNTAALVDEQLNAILDLTQASTVASPCESFDAALSQLESELTERSRQSLIEADVTVVAPGVGETTADCEGHQTRLDALRSTTQTGAPPRTVARSARTRAKAPKVTRHTEATTPAGELKRPASPAPSAKSGQRPKASPPRKLDDDLRPFSKAP